MRPFRFLATAGGYPGFAELTSLARKAEAIGCSRLRSIPDHLIGQYGAMPLLAVVAAASEHCSGGHLRAQCLPAPSGRTGPGPRYTRCAVRRPPGDRTGRGLEQARARRYRHCLRAGRCPDQAPDRGDHDPQGLLRRRAILLLGRALHRHRPRRRAPTGATPTRRSS